MKCIRFAPLARGSLQGFADLAMGSGLVMLGCSYHQVNGKRWVNPPSRPQLDSARKVIVGDNGKVTYTPVIEFLEPKVRQRWSVEALAAVDAFLDSKAPADAGAMNWKP